MPRLLTGLAAVLLLVAPVAGQGPPAGGPVYVDDDQFLDDFTDKLAALDADGKCLSAADIVKKTEADRVCKLATLAPADAPLSPEAVFRKARPSVFLVGCVKRPANGGAYTDGWFASGWAVSADGVLVTNYHVFENPDGMAFGAADQAGNVYPVTDILAVNKRADVAVVKVAGKGFAPLPVAAGPPAVGAWVGVLSHPGNQPFTFTQGTVTRYSAHFGGLSGFGERWMGLTAEFAGGSSGGPVLDRCGNVVGMACLTSNIDHDGHDELKPTRSRRRADDPPPPQLIESKVQMVVKMAVPVTLVRKAVSAPLDPADPASAPDPDPAAQTAAITKRFERATERLGRRMAAAADDAEAKALEQQLAELRAGFGKGLLRIAEADPADARGVPALCDAVLRSDGSAADRALAVLTKYHAKSDKLAGVLVWLAGGPTEAGEALLHAVADANPSRECQGAAKYALGLAAKRRAKDGGQKPDRKAAERWLTEVAERYADVRPANTDPPLGVLAKKHLAGVANLGRLRFGQLAPDIAGDDLEGQPMTLSGFKGQVVLLDFWAYWCPACLDLVPAQVKLLDELKGQPFVIVGVNADDDPERLAKGRQETPLPWRSFRNATGKDMPTIADAWCVDAYPTLVLIGKDGRILKTWEGEPDAEELAAEVKAALK